MSNQYVRSHRTRGRSFRNNKDNLFSVGAMEFFFPFLKDPCDPSNCDADLVCLTPAEKREARAAQLLRQDGMPSRFRRSFAKNKGIERNNSYSTRDDTDDESVTSYFPSKHTQHTGYDSETGNTYPTTGTSSRSCDSDDSVWSETDHTRSLTNHTTSAHSVTSHTKNIGRHRRTVYSGPTYGILEEAASEDDSVADSVDAVKNTKAKQQEDQRNYFDYIRRAANNITSNPGHDPPSDKSLGTARSIRAEDAGSVMLRKGVIKPKNNEMLALAILRRRQLDAMQKGPEP